MSRQNQSFSLELRDFNNNADLWSGQDVKLKNGAFTWQLTEIGTSAQYWTSQIPPDEYDVYVNDNKQTFTVGVGVGSPSSVDALNNPNSNLVTDENGKFQLQGPNTVVTSVYVDGSSQTGDVNLDAVYNKTQGSVIATNLSDFVDDKTIKDSGIPSSKVVRTDIQNTFDQLIISLGDYYYLGNPATDGTIRFSKNDLNFKFEILENGLWQLAELNCKKNKIGPSFHLENWGDFLIHNSTDQYGIVSYTELMTDGSNGDFILPSLTVPSGKTEVQTIDTADTGPVVSGFSYLTPASTGQNDSLVDQFWVRSGATAATGAVRLCFFESDALGVITNTEPKVKFTWTKDEFNAGGDIQADINKQFQVRENQNYVTVWDVSINPIGEFEVDPSGTFSLLGVIPGLPVLQDFSPWFAINFQILTKNKIDYKSLIPAFGQLSILDNNVSQSGFSTTYQKVTQYDTNGVESGGVVVDIPNSEIEVEAGVYNIRFSHSMITSSSNKIMTFGIFDITDTLFANPILLSSRKVGTGSDIGSTGADLDYTFASKTKIAMYAKTDSGTTGMTIIHGSWKVDRLK